MTLLSPDDLTAFRSEHELSRAELAAALCVNEKELEAWETGRDQPPVLLRLALTAISSGGQIWEQLPSLNARSNPDDVMTHVHRRIDDLAIERRLELLGELNDHLPEAPTPAETMLLALTLQMTDGYNSVERLPALEQAWPFGTAVYGSPRTELGGAVAALGFECRSEEVSRRLAVFIDDKRRGERLPENISRDAALIAQGVRVFSLTETEILTDPDDCVTRIETILNEMTEACLHDNGFI